MASVYERISSALSSLGKRRERDGDQDGGGGGGGTPGSSRQPKRFRPWEQSDLHRRLETYKPLTWFAKPASVGPVPCALKGWANDSTDSLSCEHCGSKLVYPPHVPYTQRQAAADMFSPSLTTKHAATCPWRQTHCKPSLLAYVPSNSNDELCQLFNSLNSKLLRVDVLPELDAIAIQAVRDSAAPYGSYDDLVLGGAGGGRGHASANANALSLVRRQPRVTIVDEDDASAEAEAEGNGSAAGGGATVGPLSPQGECNTIIIQPSKLTPQQKARLLALLGWDMDVLAPDSAAGAAAAPYAQSSGYSLQHLGVRPRKPSVPTSTAAAAAATTAGAAATGASAAAAGGGAGSAPGCELATSRVPMSSVVLKCHHCNGKMGLWNFAGVRPVPSGRLTPAASAAAARQSALLSPLRGPAGSGGGGASGVLGAGAGAGGAAAAAAAPVAAVSVPSIAGAQDPLAGTIAGGSYGAFGPGGAAARPFGAASSAPFRFGSSAAAEPVFGVAALDAQARGRAGSGSSSGSLGAGGAWASGPAAAVLPSTPAPASSTPAPRGAGGAAGGGGATLTGHKRKVEAEPMAVDTPAAPRAQQVGQSNGAADAGKRPRLASHGDAAGGGAASPSGARGGGGGGFAAMEAAAAAGEMRQLDPVSQHRSWCPWVYTGTPDERHMSGWQHMLSALSSQQRQQEQSAQATRTGSGGAAGGAAGPAGEGPASPDAKQLRDNALAAIRSL